MLNEQALLDLARAIGLIATINGQEQLDESWVTAPLGKTDLALRNPTNRERLVSGLEAILEDRAGQTVLLGDDLVTAAIPKTPLQLLLRHQAGALQLGVGVAYTAPNGRLELGLQLFILTYTPGGNPLFQVADHLDLAGQLLLMPQAGGPFEKALFAVEYQDRPTQNGPGQGGRLSLHTRIDALKGCATDPLEVTFVLDPIDAPEGWEGQLLRIGLTGLQVALGHLVHGQGVPAAVVKVSEALFEHLLPLFGLEPGPVPGLATAYQLPALSLQGLLERPASAFQHWLAEVFLEPSTRSERATACLHHLSQLLTLKEAQPVVGMLQGPTCTEGNPAWKAPLTAGPIPIPNLLLWVEEQIRQGVSIPTLGLGIQLDATLPALGTGATPNNPSYFHAIPKLELTLEALTIPLQGVHPVTAFRQLELRTALEPAASDYILEKLRGPKPNDPLIEHLARFEGGLRLNTGVLEPFLTLHDLQIGGQAAWTSVDLLSAAALVEVGTSAALEALTDSLSLWLGADIGERLMRLLGLRPPAGITNFPLVVPAPVNGQPSPDSPERIRRLFSDLPGTYAEWLYRLLDPDAPVPLTRWLDELKGLLDALFDSAGPASPWSGDGSSSQPWRLSLLPPGAGSPFELDLALELRVRRLGNRRDFSARLVCDLLKEQQNQVWLTSGARLELLNVTLVSDAAGKIQARNAQAFEAFKAGVTLDSNLVLLPPALNPQGAPRQIRLELGEAEASVGLSRTQGQGFWLEAQAYRIPAPTGTGPDVLSGPTFRLLNLEPDGDPGHLPVHLLAGAFGLDCLGAEQNDAAARRSADALLGLARFLGWVPESLLPGAWPGFDPTANAPEFSPGLDTLPALTDLFRTQGGDALVQLLIRRMLNPSEDGAGVGGQNVLNHFAAWVNGTVSPMLLAQPGTAPVGVSQDNPSPFRTGAGTLDDPWYVTLIKDRQGRPVFEGVAWRVERAGGGKPTHLGLGLRSVLVEDGGSTPTAILTEGVIRVDLALLAVDAPTTGSRLQWLPANVRYDVQLGRKNGSPLFSSGSSPTLSTAQTLKISLPWREDTGLEPFLALTGALWQGQGPGGTTAGTVLLHDPLAAPLLDAIQSMPDSPFSSGSGKTQAMLKIVAALGLLTLNAGGGGAGGSGAGASAGFLAAPVQRLSTDPGQYLKDQFTDPSTGVLRLGTLIQALETQPNGSAGLLELLGLKRAPQQSGFDLSVLPDGTLRLTAVEVEGATEITWLDVQLNPVSKRFALDAHYPPSGEPVKAYLQAGGGRPFRLGLESSVEIANRVLGKNRLELVPPDWPTIFRLLGVVLGGVGTVVGLWFLLKKVAEPRMLAAAPDTRAFFVSAGWLKASGNTFRIPNLIELIKEGAKLPDKLFALATLQALDRALGVKRFFQNKFQLAMTLTGAAGQNPPTRTDLLLGTTLDPQPTTPAQGADWVFGRTKLGRGFGLELLLAAGAPIASGALNPGAFGAFIGLGMHALFGAVNAQQAFGLRGGLRLGDSLPAGVPAQATADANQFTLDLVMKGTGNEEAFPLYPSFGLTGLSQFLGLTGQGGRLLMILALEGLIKGLHEYLTVKTARDLVAHFLAGMGVLTRDANSAPVLTNLSSGDVDIDPAALAQLIPGSATPPYPQAMLGQLDAFYLTETLMDLATLFHLPVVNPGNTAGKSAAAGSGSGSVSGKGTSASGTSASGTSASGTSASGTSAKGTSAPTPLLKNSPQVQGRHLVWTLLERADDPTISLQLVAGNLPTVHENQGQTGAGLRFHLYQPDEGGFELLELGYEEEPVLWSWLELETTNGQTRLRVAVEAVMQALLTLPLTQSRHILRAAAHTRVKLDRGSLEPELSVSLQTGRREPLPAPQQAQLALALRGLELKILPELEFGGSSQLVYSPPGTPAGLPEQVPGLTTPTDGKVDGSVSEGIVSLASTLVAELLLLEASIGADKILGLDLPFIDPSFGEVLGGIRDGSREDTTRKRLFLEGAVWTSPVNPARINPKNILPDLLESLKGGGSGQKSLKTAGGSQAKSAPVDVLKSVSLAVSESGNVYGVSLGKQSSMKLLPFADLVLGDEALLETETPLILWLAELRSPILGDPDWKVAFKPGIQLKGVGLKFHGKDDRPLIDQGSVQLESVMVAGSLHLGFGAADVYGGVKLVVDELALPLGKAKGETPANRMLAEDGTNPGVSLWASYAYDARGEGFKLGFTGGDEDEQGVHWFPVHTRKGEADLGRIGVGYLQPPAGVLEGELTVRIDGRFGLGPLTVEVEGFGVKFKLKNTFKPREWDIELAGLGISYVSSSVTVIGALKKSTNPDGYVGAAVINLKAFELSALGAWSRIALPNTNPVKYAPSLFLFARISATPGLGGPPFFFVKGLAGGFGFNRAFILPNDTALVANHALIAAMNPPPNTTAMSLIESIQRTLPPRQHAYWLALGVDFTCFALIRGHALLYLALDQGFTIGVIGKASFIQPAAKPILSIELAFDAGFSTTDNDPRLWVKAALTQNSWLFTPDCRLTGGFALAAWFKRKDMVLTLGGYHRDFLRPDYYPVVDRVGLEYRPCNEVRIGGETYFALTPREMMAGMRMVASYQGKVVYAHFESWFDARLGWDPFFYDLSMGIQIAGGLNGFGAITLSATLHIWGPPFGGLAEAKICGIGIKVKLGKTKDLTTGTLALSETVKRHVLQKSASDPVAASLLYTDTGRALLFRDSARLAVAYGRRTEPNQTVNSTVTPNPAQNANTPPALPGVLEVGPEFRLELRLTAPATEVRVAGSEALLPVTIASPSGTEVRTTAFDPVDLIMSKANDYRFPLLLRLRKKLAQPSSPTAVPGADAISLLDTSRVEVSVKAGFFPSAVYANPPMTTIRVLGMTLEVPNYNAQPMTLPMAEQVSVRFKKQRGPAMSFRPREEGRTVGLPLQPVYPSLAAPSTGGSKSAPVSSGKGDTASSSPPPEQAPILTQPVSLQVTQARKTATAASQVPSSAQKKSAGGNPNRTELALSAGGLVQVSLDNLTKQTKVGLKLTLSGDQAIRVAALGLVGNLLLEQEVVAGAQVITLPAGTASLTLQGLGKPPVNGPDGKALVTTPAAQALFTRYALGQGGKTALAALGINPEDRLIHAGRGIFLARGASLQVLTSRAGLPGQGYHAASDVLAPVRLFNASFPAFTGTMLLHLRPGPSQASLVDPAKAHDRVGRATTGTIQRFMGAGVVTCGAELGVLYDVAAVGAWSLLVDLKGEEIVAGISLLPGAPTAWTTELAKGRGWTGVDDGPFTLEGQSQLVLEVL